MASAEAAAPRSTTSWRLPRPISDAFILLRIERDVEFIASYDGRSKTPSVELWDGIATELRASFPDTVGIDRVTGRFLLKMWSFIEKEVKVCEHRHGVGDGAIHCCPLRSSEVL